MEVPTPTPSIPAVASPPRVETAPSIPVPAPVPSIPDHPVVTTTTTTSSLPASASYDLADSHAELDKLKGVLQKLQAENVSLKAQLGTMTEDEKDVQRELGSTVAEIGKLSSELSLQRQRVLEAKNRLWEASAELKAHQEQKR